VVAAPELFQSISSQKQINDSTNSMAAKLAGIKVWRPCWFSHFTR